MKRYSLLPALACLLLSVWGCTELQPRVSAGTGASPGKVQIALQAFDFKFQPNNIMAYTGDVLDIVIYNETGREHNFTVTDPAGRKIQSVDLPPNKSAAVEVALTGPGIYDFYCNKPFHAMLGMTGRIRAVKR